MTSHEGIDTWPGFDQQHHARGRFSDAQIPRVLVRTDDLVPWCFVFEKPSTFSTVRLKTAMENP
jgi:hypothetical protein